jgi:transposase
MEREMTQREAGRAIDLTDRQIRRLVKRIEEEGDKGIFHKARSKRPNRWKKEKKERVLKLYQSHYAGFGPTLATEKLLERDRIKISKETLRLWLVGSDIPYKRRKKKPHRQWRERRAHCGSLVQMDGSHHPWFEDRGPQSVLMAYIDDATGRVSGRFYEYEGTVPAMESFKLYVLKYGLPMAIYADKHSTYKSPSEPTIEEQLEGIEPMSQFERGLHDLGVKMIHAHSPQAKGRIERLFGTFQDRLVKEMKLADICSIQEANAFLETYLPIYNAKFNVKSREEADLHRWGLTPTQLDQALCIKTRRTLRNDFTVSYNKTLYQIKENLRTNRVTVEERLDGTIRISYQNKSISYEVITTIPEKINKPAKTLIKLKKRKRSPTNPFNKIERNKMSKEMAHIGS